MRRGPIVSCGLLRQAENCSSSLFIQIYSLFLSQMVGVWISGLEVTPQPYYPNPPSAAEHISQMKSFSPSVSKLHHTPPSIRLLPLFFYKALNGL